MTEAIIIPFFLEFFESEKSMEEADIETLSRKLGQILENYKDPDSDKDEVKSLLEKEVLKLAEVVNLSNREEE